MARRPLAADRVCPATGAGAIDYNRPMVADWLFRLVFVAYCLTVGLLLLYAPWTGTWDALVAAVPGGWRILGRPLLRGALSGFGLVHLVWVLNDLDEMLRSHGADGQAS